MNDAQIANTTFVFDRTPVARLIACAAVFASAALVFGYLARGLENVRFLPLLALCLLFAGTVLSALLQYGDRIYVSPEGLLYDNRLLRFIRGRWLRWDEVVEVREIRRRILVLLSRDGQRVLVDAITGYRIARREILRRTPHAVISGTLTRSDRP
ncbi:MAG TPA: hypothetical protein VM534_08065 [Thermoanaerobaculia bacterium]|nr:hypothetical protein [Thermoanaerobaculia bacterium]